MASSSLSAPDRDGYAYPLFFTDQRALEPAYQSELYLCDIDNTYLISHYKSFRDLIRLRFEAAHEKQPVPGAPALLKALRFGPAGEQADDSEPRRPIYFVSASPETMRPVIQKRFLLDGVSYDGAAFRDLWTKSKPHLRHLKEIYGFKIAALLIYRHRHPRGAREILIGDNLEHDPEIYTLYARICAGTLRSASLDAVLETRGVLPRDRKYILSLAEQLPLGDPVEHILIRKIRSRPADESEAPFDSADERVQLFDDYLQTALWLLAFDKIHGAGARAVAQQIQERRPDFKVSESLADLRAALPEDRAARLDDWAKSMADGPRQQPSEPPSSQQEPPSDEQAPL